MVGSICRLTCRLALVLAATCAAVSGFAADPPPQNPPSEKPAAKADRSSEFALPGEDPPAQFVPLHPRSVEKRREIEALRDYSAARALEDNRALSDAIILLESALKLEPDSVAILRRLSRLCLVKQNKTDQALEYSRRVLELEPGDTDTISLLVMHYTRKGDSSGLESVLKRVLDNPNLDNHSAGRLLAEYELGKLYANRLQRIDKAADAFAKVVDGLDEKDANKLTPLDQERILGSEPADAYLEFGNVFLEAKRYELAVRAFERGLVYKEDHPQIPLRLAETLLKQGKGPEALTLVEAFLKRQPGGSEGYELLKRILTSLHRENEITPRLEEAAKADSKNLPLQYALADQYREIGQVERAEALYKELLAAQPTPDGYRALAASLLKRRKAEELLKVFVEAVPKPGGLDAVRGQIEAVIKDPKLAGEMIDAGYKMLSAEPPRIDRGPAVNILTAIAKDTGQFEKMGPILRLLLKQNPNPQLYREIAQVYETAQKPDEVVATLEEMLTRFPGERNARTLTVLGEFLRRAGKFKPAIETLQESLKLEPNNGDTQLSLGFAQSQSGKLDEAIETFRSALKHDAGNARLNGVFGQILLQNGRNDEAIALYKGLLERFPNNDDMISTARQGLSVAYVNKGDYAKGEAELEILYERDPDEAGVNNDLGYLYAEQGKNLEKAEAMIRKALQQRPDEAAYLDSLGWVLFKRGKFKEAIEPLEQAVKHLSGGGDATIYEHLGDVYFRLQENAKAKVAWEHAEKAATKAIPTDKRLPEIRKKLESLGKLAPSPKPAGGDTP